MDANLQSEVAAVSALDEPIRRRLYDYVRRQRAAVGRDDAARELGINRQTAAFHLDKLADEGLLSVEFARRDGRSGPGAGRPSKLYRRSNREVSVQLPERAYELIGRLLACAIEDADGTGESPRKALRRRAREFGAELGASAEPGLAGLLDSLEGCGYEPRYENAEISMVNCPFHAISSTHTELVCGMNLELMEGVLDSGRFDGCLARLRPEEGRCCVTVSINDENA